jgi:hypothetical protein
VHTVLRYIDECRVIANSNATHWQLKTNLPTYFNLKRSLTSVLIKNESLCCSIAHFLYTNCPNPTFSDKSSTERKSKQRLKEDVRLREQAADTAARKSRRDDHAVSLREQTSNTRRRKILRLDPDVREEEQAAKKARRSAARQCANVEELIQRFHSIISNGPVFICSCCDQLLYRHSVQPALSLRSRELPNCNLQLQNILSSDGIEYVCNTCHKYLRQSKMPPCAISNNLKFPPIPPHNLGSHSN